LTILDFARVQHIKLLIQHQLH